MAAPLVTALQKIQSQFGYLKREALEQYLRAIRRAALPTAFGREFLPAFSTHAAKTGDVENLP